MKVDLHVHTLCSPDSLTPPRDVLRWAARRNLGALAITDHNTVAGAFALAQQAREDRAPVQIIVGEEILTTHGEIIGLFLRQAIPPKLSPRETVGRIHDQGGLVYVPHPVDRVRHSAIEWSALRQILDEVDLIEVFNARVTFAADNRIARDLALSYHLLQGAGSDAHQRFEIGRAYVEMPPFTDAPGFLKSLSRGRVQGHISSPLVHVGSTYAKFAKGIIALGDAAK